VHLVQIAAGTQWFHHVEDGVALASAARMKTKLVAALLASAGCTVMVNGKPKRIGGGDDTPAAVPTSRPTTAATTPAPTSATPSKPAAPAPAPVPATAAQTIIVDGTLTSRPQIAAVARVAFDSTYQHVLGRGSTSCGSHMPAAPIASIEVKPGVTEMTIVVTGSGADGFVLAHGDKRWSACSRGELATISKLDEGWAPGRYDIYPVTFDSRRAAGGVAVEVFEPSKPAPPWRDGIQTIAISAKLPTPIFVDVTAQPGRRRLRKEHAGWGCEDAAFGFDPDLVLDLQRPIAGLIVRQLPAGTDITLRRELRTGKRPDRGCPKHGAPGDRGAPSYWDDREVRFDSNDEGRYGISIGTPDDRPVTVTLMILDASTTLDPLAQAPYRGDASTLRSRWIGLVYPQLDLDTLGAAHTYANAERAAQVFAKVPAPLRVYAKLDLDADLAHGASDEYPKKNEALLVLRTGNDRDQRVEVLAADGIRYTIKPQHLLLAPDGAAVFPDAPRPLRNPDIERVLALLPPEGKGAVAAHQQKLKAYDACVDRVWEPYERRLPTITHPSDVDIVVVESAGARHIREAGEAAVARACGTRETLMKKIEGDRVRLIGEVQKARAKLLAKAVVAGG
jgi:hypothetical protein